MSGNTNSDIWIAGAVAAFTVDLLVYPLDTLKTRIQSPDYRKLYVNESTNTLRRAVLFRGLYQGLGSVILATLPSCMFQSPNLSLNGPVLTPCKAGAFFTTYEGVKSLVSDYGPSAIPQPLNHAIASGSAELVSCAILTPAEVIKQNAQMVSKASVEQSQTSATRQTLQKFTKNPFALWRGYSALAGRNLPFTALQFPLFENFKGVIQARVNKSQGQRKSGEAPLWQRGAVTATAAGTAGAISAVITTPIDVVKTRIMLNAATSFADQSQASGKAVDALKEGKVVDALGEVKTSSANKPKALSTMAITRDILDKQGWKGLWRGGALRAVWTMLGSGLYLAAYETGRVYLQRRRGDFSE